MIWKIESENQRIYFFTKVLQVDFFFRIMKFLCSWQALIREVLYQVGEYSDLHSEYVALSCSFRYLLPLKIMSKENIDNMGIDNEKLKFVSRYTFMRTTKVP